MGKIGDAVGDLKEATTLLSARGLIGGAYFGGLVFAASFGHAGMSTADVRPWILGLSLFFGFIAASISYEVLLPLFGGITAPIVSFAFHRTTRELDPNHVPKRYSEIRRFREEYLADGSSEHRKQRLQKDEQLRQMMTYLCSASLSALLVLSWCFKKHPMPVPLHDMLRLVSVGVLTSTFLAQFSRSYAFGRTIGLAFLEKSSEPVSRQNSGSVPAAEVASIPGSA